MLLMFIVGGKLDGFLATLTSKGSRGVCLSKRDVFCSSNPSKGWKASSMEYKGEKCSEILTKGSKKIYSCQKEGWMTSCEYECYRLKTKSGKVLYTVLDNLCANKDRCKKQCKVFKDALGDPEITCKDIKNFVNEFG